MSARLCGVCGLDLSRQVCVWHGADGYTCDGCFGVQSRRPLVDPPAAEADPFSPTDEREHRLDDVYRLVRCLWQTDPRVVAFVKRISEGRDPAPFFEKAWNRGELVDVIVEYIDRVDAMLDVERGML